MLLIQIQHPLKQKEGMAVDALICPEWTIPIEPRNVVWQNHAVVIDKGRIVAMLPKAEATIKYQAQEVINLPGQVLLPGLVNAHTHSPMTLFRGLANDLPLMTWLNDYIWPAEKKWLSDEFVYVGTRLAIAEMIKSGTTCFNDHYFYADAISRAADEASMRATIGGAVIDFPTSWSKTADEAIDKNLQIRENYLQHPLISVYLGPHAPYTVGADTLRRVKQISDKFNLPIQMHVHETSTEIEQFQQKHNKRPLQWLAELGLLSSRFQCIHMTQVNDDDLAILQQTKAHVVHCPESNLKLASGFCPVARLIAAEINVALGTDSVASNNDLDMFAEMRTAALLAKGVAGNATVLPAAEALQMATLNGARALGLDQEIGTLGIGKAADVITVDLTQLPTQPVYDPLAHLVYSANCRQVTNVWVAGKRLLQDGQLTTMDEPAILQQAMSWGRKINT